MRFASLVLLMTSLSMAVAGASDGGADPTPGSAVTGATGDGSGAAGGGGDAFSTWLMPVMLLGLVAFMYFVLIRPQKKEQDKRKAMLSSLKQGNRVVTIGGLHGTVVRVGEKTVDIRVSEGKDPVVLTFNLAAVHEIPAEDSSAKEAK